MPRSIALDARYAVAGRRRRSARSDNPASATNTAAPTPIGVHGMPWSSPAVGGTDAGATTRKLVFSTTRNGLPRRTTATSPVGLAAQPERIDGVVAAELVEVDAV